MKKPLVSIIIPTYKSGETLLRAIDSVLGQTYENFEIIVVDDNNPDTPERLSTQKLMQKYCGNEKVQYVLHEKNKNGSAARNTGVRHSAGEFLCFLDDDDYFMPEKLKFQVDYMLSHPEYDGNYCWRIDRGEEICGTYVGDLTKEILTLEFSPVTSAIMITKHSYDAINGFDESYRRHQDFEFILRFFEKFSISYIPSIQIVKDDNGVNNTPKGEKLVKLKEQFFAQFGDKIGAYKTSDKEAYNKIYLRHYVPVFKDLIRYGYPLLAIKIYFKYGLTQGFAFWRYFYKLCRAGQIERINKLRSK